MKEWLKADSPADVGKFYDEQYRRDGLNALSKGDWHEIISKLIEVGGSFSKNKRLLEAGCGHGEFLSNICEEVDCVGIDISAVACQLAQKRLGEDAEILHMGMEDLGGLFTTFDYVVSFGAIEHTMNPRKCFDNLLNLVKPGGVLYVLVPLDFEDCFRYIRQEAIQKTNERFATAEEWLEYFGNKQESWFIVGGNAETKDLAIIVRKERQ